MRLPLVPGPADVRALLAHAGDLLEEALQLVPRASRLLEDVDALIRRIETTRQAADALVARTEQPVDRLLVLLDRLEPPLTRLQPTIERLADTTSPEEVEALVSLVDQLPGLVQQVERDLLPVLGTLGSVAPDLHDLLDVSRELNDLMAKVPGLGRIKRRVDDDQAARQPR